MKVVLFCGGMGTRLKEFSETIPKPLVDVGGTPIIMQLMRYYAHFGHRDFIVCLGFGAEHIKQYFLTYDECLASDFVYAQGGKRIELASNHMSEWTITFVDTGLYTTIGERLKAVRKYVGSDEVFMANYADGLTDLDLGDYLKFFLRQNRIASFVSVRPRQSFHYVIADEAGSVQSVQPIGLGSFYINGGFFIFKHAIFNYINNGDDLVGAPFQQLIREGELVTYRHPGFWACMDTLKEKRALDELYTRGQAPWAVWQRDVDRFGAKSAISSDGRDRESIVLRRPNLAGRRRAQKYAIGK
jgi:glucose-1-phosphate cytidylyltransferase